MISLAEGDIRAVGEEAAGVPAVAVFETQVEDMRWCPDCGGSKLFVEVFRCDAGRVGYCAGC